MTTNIPDRNQVRSAVEVYLDNLHQTLFLDWDLTQEERKAQAIEFVTDLVLAIESQRQEMFSDLVLAFAQGASEAPQAPATALSDREAAIRRHPSYSGPEPAEEPSQRRYVGTFNTAGEFISRLSLVPKGDNVVPFKRPDAGFPVPSAKRAPYRGW